MHRRRPADHVGGDNLQRTRSGKWNSTFCNAEEAHEKGSDARVIFSLVEPGATQERCHTNRDWWNRDGCCDHTHWKWVTSSDEPTAEEERCLVEGPAHVESDHRAKQCAQK